MQWTDRFKIDVDLIDDQHKEWFARVADFQAAINQKEMISEMARTLKFLVEYSQKHLHDEENYMRQIQYPHLDSQIRHHEAFMQRIVEMLNDLKKGKKILPSQLLDFMVNWIRQHILEHDRKIGEFLAARQAGSNVDPDAVKTPIEVLHQKLKELAGLVKSGMISPKEHEDKKKELVVRFASNASAHDDESLLETCDKLVVFQEKGLISKQELYDARSVLKSRTDLNHELALCDTPKLKIGTLKRLLENELITAGQFETVKADILQRM
jgi:hemerythrin-like metal-binding protein